MVKNYIKIAIRNIRKNKVYSFISILVLALAIGCFTLPFLFADKHISIDTFHENINEIFYVENRIGKSGGGELWGPTPTPLGPALKHNFPQVLDYVRVNRVEASVKIEDRIFNERIYFVDNSFLNVFTFPIISEDKSVLNHRDRIVITDRCAEKYFKGKNPLGKKLIITNGEKFRESFVIKGVVKKPPWISSLQFDILMPFERLKDWRGKDLNDWGDWTHTFILLKNKEDIAALEHQKMDNYIQLQNEAQKSWPIQSFLFEPFADLSVHTHLVNNDIGIGFPTESIVGLSICGIFILFMACFNYINIGIVMSSRRLREIGIRKVLGSNRSKLIVQFLGEHVIICLAAVALGAYFTHTCILPFFNRLFTTFLEMDFLNNYKLWIFYGITLLITVIGSGGYPALYVSRFNPVNILKKTQKFGGGAKIVNVLLSFQFVLTFLLIGTALIFIENATYQKNIDWGYNQEQIINVPLKDKNQYEIYRNSISQNPNIISVSGTRNHIGRPWDVSTIKYQGEEYTIPSFTVGNDYLKTMQIRFKKGRTFNRDLASDDQSIIINEKFIRRMEWEKPVGKSVVIDSTEYSVIGVVEDFYNQPFTEPVKPVLIKLCDPEDYRYLSIRVRAGEVVQTAKFLETTWKQLFPYIVYESFYQDRIWEWFFQNNVGIYKLSCFIAFIALGISCMGLYGLVSVSIVKRIKEISIRKVFGASMMTIVKLLNKNTLRILVISSIIGCPLCYLFMSWYLDLCYINRTPLTLEPFLIATIIMICSSLLTVFSLIIKGARMSIIDSLREE